VLAAGETVANQDATTAYPALVAADLLAEYGTIGFGGQGWNNPGTSPGNVPAITGAWDLYSAGLSRLSGGLLSPSPDYLLCSLGQNDVGDLSAVAATVVTMLAAWRAAAPSAMIFVCLPQNLVGETQIRSGFTTAADSNAFLIDHDEDLTPYTQAGLSAHLSAAGHARYANLIIDRLPVRSVSHRSV
jgi:hypothetical protein